MDKKLFIATMIVSLILLIATGYRIGQIDKEFLEANNTLTQEQKQVIQEYVKKRTENTTSLLLPLGLIIFMYILELMDFKEKMAIMKVKIEILKMFLNTIEPVEGGENENENVHTA